MLYVCGMENSGIVQACESAGGATALARRLGVGPSAVAQWRSGDRPVPAERCVQIEQSTGVRRWLLRQADWWRIWPELIGAPDAPPAGTAPAERAA